LNFPCVQIDYLIEKIHFLEATNLRTLIKNLYTHNFLMLMDPKSRSCTFCGRSPVSVYWSFKTTAYCTFRCYATSSARLLLLLSTIFGLLFAGLIVAFALLDINPAIYITVSVALIFGPIPGFIISLLGFKYRRENKKNPPVKIQHEEKESVEAVPELICSICNEAIQDKQEKAIVEPCMHEFHRSHLASWTAENYNCPECNNEIEKITFTNKK